MLLCEMSLVYTWHFNHHTSNIFFSRVTIHIFMKKIFQQQQNFLLYERVAFHFEILNNPGIKIFLIKLHVHKFLLTISLLMPNTGVSQYSVSVYSDSLSLPLSANQTAFKFQIHCSLHCNSV